MREFTIQIHSVQDVQAFVDLSTSRAFPVWVGNEHHQVNGKNFMEVCCLDFSHPLWASVDCSEEEFQHFLRDAQRFLVK